jgi:hypothetical protein
LAVRFLTGSSGRLVAFIVDVVVASATYLSKRMTGREVSW